MKTRKWFRALLAVTVLTTAAIPMTASAAADNISINGVDGLVKNNADEDETFCKFEFSGDAMTITRGESANGTVSSCYMNGAEMGDSALIDLSATPYVYWDTEGTTTFDVYIRFADGDEGLAKLAALSGNGDGIAMGKGSINLLEAIQNDSVLKLDGTEISITAVKFVVNGNTGDSITFNKLYFGEAGQDDAEPSAIPAESTSSDTEGTNSTAVDTTTTEAPADTTQKANPSTGEGTQAFAALALAAAAVGVLMVVKQQKQR